MATIYLNGVRLPDESWDGDVRQTYREEDESGRKAKGSLGDIEFRAEGYDILKGELIDDPDGLIKSVDITVTLDCCDDEVAFTGEIRGVDIRWCVGDCAIKVSAIEKTADTLIVDCLKSTVISESEDEDVPTGFLDKVHPRMVYCDALRPRVLHIIIISFGFLFIMTMKILRPLLVAFNAIVKLVCVLAKIAGKPCEPEMDDGILDTIDDMLRQMEDDLLGCNRNHPSGLVRGYIRNACKVCGATFSSSIFNEPSSPYFNSVYLFAPMTEGKKHGENNYALNPDNVALDSGELYLDTLKDVVNGKWRVRNGILMLERKDYFLGETRLLADQIPDDRLIEFCFTYSKDDLKAYGDFQYSQDAIDTDANSLLRWYNEIVSYNTPKHELFRGKHDVMLQYAPMASRAHSGEGDFRQSGFIRAFLPNEANYRKAILLSTGLTALPKLIEWDGESKEYAYPYVEETESFGRNGQTIVTVRHVNRAFWFTQERGRKPAEYVNGKLQLERRNTLYHNFHQIDDPRIVGYKKRGFTLKFTYGCSDLENLSIGGVVEKEYGGETLEGVITNFEVNHTTKLVEVVGVV